MGFLDKVRETLRDKSGDELCAHLRSLGIDAQMAPRGRAREYIAAKKGLVETWESLGVVDISGGLIHWVNVLRERTEHVTLYGIDYGVPDPNMTPGFPMVEVKMVVKKSFLLVGRVIDIEWRGNRHGKSVAADLNNDSSLKNPLIEREMKVKIRAYPYDGCWLIMEEKLKPPTIEVWECYQRIAQHLLSKGSLVSL